MFDRLFDDTLKIIDERSKGSEGRAREAYEEYRLILREMYGRLGELMKKMYADRILDPEEIKALPEITLMRMRG